MKFYTNLLHPIAEDMLKYGFDIIIFSPHIAHIKKQVKMGHSEENAIFSWNKGR